MDKLNGKDARALIECAGEIYSLQDRETFGLGVLRALEKVVPSHLTAYCIVSRSDTGSVTSEVLSESTLSDVEAFNRNIHEHPFINLMHADVLRPHPFMEHIMRSLSRRLPGFVAGRGKTAVKISDALTDRQFRSLAVYNEGLRKDGVNYQVGLMLTNGKRFQTVACLHRDTRDFSERDRLILNLLGPHIVQASRNAETAAWLVQAAAGGEVDGGVIVLGPDRRVRSVSEAAFQALSRHFKPVRVGGRLPEDLDRWVRAEREGRTTVGGRPPKPFGKEGPSTVLLARIVVGAAGEETIVLTEKLVPEDPRGGLEALGLTARESEVLYWVAHGKSNTVVSDILGITLNTVKKHLDRIYRKLGVENRTAAAKAALEVIGGA